MNFYGYRIRDTLERKYPHSAHLDVRAIEAYMRVGRSTAAWDTLTVASQAYWDYEVGVAVECVKRTTPANVAVVVAMLPQHEMTIGDLVAEGETLEGIERRALVEALRITGGVQAKAAKLLKISSRTMWYKIKQFNLQPRDFLSLVEKSE